MLDFRARHTVFMSCLQVQVDARQVERKAQAAQQSMTRRAQRLDKAQAAATQAHLAAVERQSSLQREHNIQPARASLQQVHLCPAPAQTNSYMFPVAASGGSRGGGRFHHTGCCKLQLHEVLALRRSETGWGCN